MSLSFEEVEQGLELITSEWHSSILYQFGKRRERPEYRVDQTGEGLSIDWPFESSESRYWKDQATEFVCAVRLATETRGL